MSNTIIKANRQTDYFTTAAELTRIDEEIGQLQETAAIADITQTTNALPRWGIDQNLLVDSGVLLDDLDNMTAVNSLDFVELVSAPPNGLCDVLGTLYWNGATLDSGGDVDGPVSATDNAIARFDGVTGKLIQESQIIIDDVGDFYNGVTKFVTQGVSTNFGVGQSTLTGITSGVRNTACGSAALITTSSGSDNTAVGYNALNIAAAANGNTAVGSDTMSINLGSDNTSVGNSALTNATGAVNTIAIGSLAGSNCTTCNTCIYIGNNGSDGETSTIRLGSIHSNAYVSGIYGQVTPTTGTRVVSVDASNKLTAKAMPYEYNKQSSDVVTVNTVSTLFYPPNGNGGAGQSVYTLIGGLAPYSMKIARIQFWVQTGGAWISSGTGITLQLMKDALTYGTPVTLTPAGINTFTSQDLANSNVTILTTDRLSCRINQTSATMDITSFGWNLFFDWS